MIPGRFLFPNQFVEGAVFLGNHTGGSDSEVFGIRAVEGGVILKTAGGSGLCGAHTLPHIGSCQQKSLGSDICPDRRAGGIFEISVQLGAAETKFRADLLRCNGIGQIPVYIVDHIVHCTGFFRGIGVLRLIEQSL